MTICLLILILIVSLINLFHKRRHVDDEIIDFDKVFMDTFAKHKEVPNIDLELLNSVLIETDGCDLFVAYEYSDDIKVRTIAGPVNIIEEYIESLDESNLYMVNVN